MGKVEFIFCCLLGEKVLKQTGNLSKILQDPTISILEGNQLGIQKLGIYVIPSRVMIILK